jgi:hypothetical protein
MFAKAVHRQAEITQQHRIVAITGVVPNYMFEFEGILCHKFPSILKVLCTPSTYRTGDHGVPTGLYNLLCQRNDFVSLARSLSQQLLQYYHTVLKSDDAEPDQAAHVAVVSKLPSQDDQSFGSNSESSLSTRNSYITALETAFAE